jgi:hypothetical protein
VLSRSPSRAGNFISTVEVVQPSFSSLRRRCRWHRRIQVDLRKIRKPWHRTRNLPKQHRPLTCSRKPHTSPTIFFLVFFLSPHDDAFGFGIPLMFDSREFCFFFFGIINFQRLLTMTKASKLQSYDDTLCCARPSWISAHDIIMHIEGISHARLRTF